MAFETDNNLKNEMNLSFAGCGFLGIYHVGVASCIKEHAPHLITQKIAGASAGALAAVGLICNSDLGKATTQVLQVALKARSFALGPLHPTFSIVNFLEELMDDFLPFNAHELASGRMHISLTRMYDRKNVIVNQFDTRDDLIQALICSAYIPFYCGLFPPQYKGTYYLDGGLSNNIPILDENTITVSPFAGESDICPSDNSSSELHVFLANTSIQLSTANLYRASQILFPPTPELMSKTCQLGFKDALRFLQKNTLISCKRHLSIYTSVTTDTPFTEAELEFSQMSSVKDFDDSRAYATDEGVSTSTEDEVDVSESPSSISSSLSSSRESLLSHCSHIESNFGDGESEYEDETHQCTECVHRRHVAVLESLPQPVVTALQTATDSVNKTILGRLYKFKALRVLGIMAAPVVLPIEVTYTLAKRFYEWAPYMPSDMTWFVKEFLNILKEMYEFVQASRHRYSARFTCQLAITDLDYPSESSRYSLPVFDRKKQHQRRSSLTPVLMQRRSLNLGFAVDFKNSHNLDPIECVNEFRQHLLDEDEKNLDIAELDCEMEEYNPRLEHVFMDEHGKTHRHLPKVAHMHRNRHNSDKRDKNNKDEKYKNSISNDTFENCLHVASQVESILSYYYTEEGHPETVKVAEIYSLDDPTGPRPESTVTDMSLAWDSFMEMKSEAKKSCSENETGDDIFGETKCDIFADSKCDRLFSKIEEETILGLGEDLSSSSQPFGMLLHDVTKVLEFSRSEPNISMQQGSSGLQPLGYSLPNSLNKSNDSNIIGKDELSPIISDKSEFFEAFVSTPNITETSRKLQFQQNLNASYT